MVQRKGGYLKIISKGTFSSKLKRMWFQIIDDEKLNYGKNPKFALSSGKTILAKDIISVENANDPPSVVPKKLRDSVILVMMNTKKVYMVGENKHDVDHWIKALMIWVENYRLHFKQEVIVPSDVQTDILTEYQDETQGTDDNGSVQSNNSDVPTDTSIPEELDNFESEDTEIHGDFEFNVDKYPLNLFLCKLVVMFLFNRKIHSGNELNKIIIRSKKQCGVDQNSVSEFSEFLQAHLEYSQVCSVNMLPKQDRSTWCYKVKSELERAFSRGSSLVMLLSFQKFKWIIGTSRQQVMVFSLYNLKNSHFPMIRYCGLEIEKGMELLQSFITTKKSLDLYSITTELSYVEYRNLKNSLTLKSLKREISLMKNYGQKIESLENEIARHHEQVDSVFSKIEGDFQSSGTYKKLQENMDAIAKKHEGLELKTQVLSKDLVSMTDSFTTCKEDRIKAEDDLSIENGKTRAMFVDHEKDLVDLKQKIASQEKLISCLLSKQSEFEKQLETSFQQSQNDFSHLQLEQKELKNQLDESIIVVNDKLESLEKSFAELKNESTKVKDTVENSLSEVKQEIRGNVDRHSEEMNAFQDKLQLLVDEGLKKAMNQIATETRNINQQKLDLKAAFRFLELQKSALHSERDNFLHHASKPDLVKSTSLEIHQKTPVKKESSKKPFMSPYKSMFDEITSPVSKSDSSNYIKNLWKE